MERLKRVQPAEMPEVLRLASELYARDRAQMERAQEAEQIAAAAAEVGLPPAYLERAAALLEARRQSEGRPRRLRSRWGLDRPRFALTAAGLLGVALLAGWWISVPQLATSTLAPPSTLAAAMPSRGGGNLSGASLPGANLSGQNLAGADIEGANLSGADLHGSDLSGANLEGANLSGARLTGARLPNADLEGANLSGASLAHADLTGADLEGANLSQADLAGGNLSKANVSGANLQGANLTDTTITGANLEGANLTGALYNRPSARDAAGQGR